MLVFSGHDSTLFPLLTALGAFDGSWPPYASYLEIQLLLPAAGSQNSSSSSSSSSISRNAEKDYRLHLRCVSQVCEALSS
jgi:hypothetical protein